MNQKDIFYTDTCIIMLDFAENDHFVLQGVIQSFHWNKSQCSIHSAVIITSMCNKCPSRKVIWFYIRRFKT